jgi:tripartite-type tricarboxylate transporter receptor subunit TctC
MEAYMSVRVFAGVAALFMALGLAAMTTDAAAQGYPTRPVRIVVPFSPGGVADVPARMLAAKLSESVGKQFVVDNRPGAGSTIGADIVAKAAPDGYTLLLLSNTHFVSASLYKKLPYDPVKDFTPILQFSTSTSVLVVHPSLGAKSVQDLIALAKAKPGQVPYASSGNGSSQHLFMALFCNLANIDMKHVPYKGSGQARSDLIGGQVPAGIPGLSSVIQEIRSGRLLALGVTGPRRSPQLPDVPTIAEAGVKGYAAEQWFGLGGPAKLPKDVVEKLNVEVAKVLKDPELKKQFDNVGAEMDFQGPEAVGKLMEAELPKWGAVVKATGLQVN